jgi:ParB family chromosome partitioning protein
MALEQRKRLGRGLDALLGGLPSEPQDRPGDQVARQRAPLALIHPNPRNPRREFREEELEELAASVRQHGIVQPLVVRPAEGGSGERFEIIAGERRWRAAQLAGLHDVPIVVLDVSERQSLELAIVENVQRSDLNPVEEARGYQALIEEFGYTQADLGAAIGKSRVHVANTLRLLRLPKSVLGMLESAALSAGHGRALLAAPEPEKLARAVLEQNLSVRETERLAQMPAVEPGSVEAHRKARVPDLVALEKELTDLLGLKVSLRHDPRGRGELKVAYTTPDQLETICAKLRG